MKPTRRQYLQDANREAIKSIAWKQIADTGAAALSLGAIAREMSLTTPALYRYFNGRDDLIAALSEDAYSSFSQALEFARDGVASEDYSGRFRAMCLAYHDWAISHPQQYILIFGTPFQGNQMDAEVSQVADHSFLTLLGVIDEADRAGKLKTASPKIDLPPGLTAQLEAVGQREGPYAARVLYLGLVSWSYIHGVTSLELYQRYSLILADRTEDFIQHEVDRLMQIIGFE